MLVVAKGGKQVSSHRETCMTMMIVMTMMMIAMTMMKMVKVTAMM